MSQYDHSDYSEKRGFGARYGFVIGLLVVVAVGVFLFSKMFSGQKGPPPRKAQEMVMIKPALPTPPPPPPPPPTPQDAPKQQMMDQSPVDESEVKPEEAPSDPSPSLGTNITGNGPPDGYGMTANKGGFMAGGNRGGKAGGSRFGWYANQVIKSLTDALSRHPLTRNAGFSVKVRIWSDLGGRVTKAKLAESTGDPTVDEVIRSEILNGFQLKEPPPDGMPMPIVTRFTARRPN